MSANYRDLLKYAATGIASPDMTYYDKMRASTLMGGVVQTLTGIPPLSFKADGTPLISWSMLGNGQQTGAPTPDAPIMPEFVGVRTANLVNPADMMDGFFINSSGEMAESARRCTTPIFGISGTQAVLSFHTELDGVHALVALFANGEMISRTSNVESGTVIDISQADSIGVSFYSGNTSVYVRKTDLQVMLNLGSTALPYEPFGWAEKITCAGQTVPVYLGEVPTVRKIRKLVLTGDENWVAASGTEERTVSYISITDSGDSMCLCSHIEYKSSYSASDINQILLRNLANRLYISIDANIAADLSAFKTYLQLQYAAGTPVTVWYVLAEPTTGIVNEPLAKIGDYADELNSADAGVSIPTVKGSNTLTVETELQPSEMTIKYRG